MNIMSFFIKIYENFNHWIFINADRGEQQQYHVLQELPNNVNVNQNRAFFNQPLPRGNNFGVQLQANNPDGQVVVHQVLEEPYNNENQDVQNYVPRQADGELARNENVLPVGANAAGQQGGRQDANGQGL